MSARELMRFAKWRAALEIGHGEKANVPAAQRALAHRATCDRAASLGAYTAALEGESP